MADIIDLSKARTAREDQPDPDCIRKDDDGLTLLLFALSYTFMGSEWTLHIWAYSIDDVEARVAAMNNDGITVTGQIFSQVPL